MKKDYRILIGLIALMCLAAVLLVLLKKAAPETKPEALSDKERHEALRQQYGLENRAGLSNRVVFENDELVLYEDRFLVKFTARTEYTQTFIKGVNALVDYSSGQCTVYVVPVPKRIQTEQTYRDTEAEQYGILLKDLRAGLKPQVKVTDVTGELLSHTDRYLFYRLTDWWTEEAALLAYRVLAKDMGLMPFDEDYFLFYQNNSFTGDPGAYWERYFEGTEYEEIADDVISDAAEPFFYRKSERFKDYESCFEEDVGEYKRPVFAHSIPGPNGIIGAKTDYAQLFGYGTEPVMVIGDKSGELLAPFLTEHFSDVYYVNIERATAGQIKKLTAKYRIKTIVIAQAVERIGDRGYERALNGFTE